MRSSRPLADNPTIAKGIERFPEQQKLLAELSATRSYRQLADAIDRHAELLKGPLAVYGLLQAANLRETISMDQLVTPDAFSQLDLVEVLLNQITDDIKEHITSYPTDTQAAIVTALMQLEFYDPAVFSLVAEANMGPLRCREETVALNLTMFTCSFALSGHYDGDFFTSLAGQTVLHIDKFDDIKTLVNVLGAYMDMNHPDTALIAAVMEVARSKFDQLDAMDTCSLLVALSFFNVADPNNFCQSLLNKAAKYNYDQLTGKHLTFLYKAINLRKMSGIPLEVPQAIEQFFQQYTADDDPSRYPWAAVVDPEVVAKMYEGYPQGDLEALMEETGLLLSHEVALRLEELGFRIRRRVMIGGGMLTVQLAVAVKDREVAVQVLDSTRFCNNYPTQIKGQPLAEVMCLEALGWRVAVVPVTEYQQLQDSQAQAEYLLQKLKSSVL